MVGADTNDAARTLVDHERGQIQTIHRSITCPYGLPYLVHDDKTKDKAIQTT